MKTIPDQSAPEIPSVQWQTILVPTDFSKPSLRAVATAAGLARQCGAKIVLLHMVHLPAMGTLETTPELEKFVDSCRSSLEQIARRIPTELVREKIVRLLPQGVVPGIVNVARECSADLIVIATHGHSGLEHVLLGSTAEKVVRHAPCPVLVVRGKAGADQRKTDGYEK